MEGIKELRSEWVYFLMIFWWFFIYRIVFDRESGKPKGYGFCEYQDVDTAQSAIRNLNGHEISGRVLRVDSASISSERQREAGSNFSFLYCSQVSKYLFVSKPNKVFDSIY